MHTQKKSSTVSGFTIVELLIVIVVIGILAAISIVAYNGIQDGARAASVSTALNQASKKIQLWRVNNADAAPATLADADFTPPATVDMQYSRTNSNQDYTASPQPRAKPLTS